MVAGSFGGCSPALFWAPSQSQPGGTCHELLSCFPSEGLISDFCMHPLDVHRLFLYRRHRLCSARASFSEQGEHRDSRRREDSSIWVWLQESGVEFPWLVAASCSVVPKQGEGEPRQQWHAGSSQPLPEVALALFTVLGMVP